MTKAGQLITDGDAVWIIDDVRGGARVGDIILRPTLRDGYIKANGATVKASEYPRLLAWVQESNMTVTAEQYKTDCSKYIYDATQDRLTLPNATGRVLMGGETVKSVEAGLPNIVGSFWPYAFDTARNSDPNSNSQGQTGAFYSDGDNYRGPSPHNAADNARAMFDASRSNPIYGASATVQPPALTMIAQIKY